MKTSNETKKITKKQFCNIVKERGFNHILPFLNLTIDLEHRLIIHKDGTITGFPTSIAESANYFCFFSQEVSETAYPQFSKGGKYRKHAGDPITVTLSIDVDGYTCKQGWTKLGNASNSYVVGMTTPRAYTSVHITDFKAFRC
jgi:hypothetical protein